MRAVRVLMAAAAAATLAFLSLAEEIKTGLPGMGPEGVLLERDDPVSAGTFDGTWMYANRDTRFALWARTKNGVPQVRLQYQSLASPEAFETDWDGKALYYMGESPVTFELKLGERSADRLAGTWTWTLTAGPSGRNETADVVIYRTGFGRVLLMDFQNFQRTIMAQGKSRVFKAPVIWNWNKVSKRELLWDEIPF